MAGLINEHRPCGGCGYDLFGLDAAGTCPECGRGIGRDVLIVESEAFSIEPPLNERGVRYDVAVGDDLAAFLQRGLNALGAPFSISDPVREDYGSVLIIDEGRNCFFITITWAGGPRDQHWAVQFEQSHGCLGLLMRRRTDFAALERIKTMTERVVLGNPDQFVKPKWLAASEFKGTV